MAATVSAPSRTNRTAASVASIAARALLAVGAIAHLVACDALVGRLAYERNEPLRGESLQPWCDRSIDGQPAIQYAFDRLALIIANADDLDCVSSDGKRFKVLATLNGAPTSESVGSAVPLTSDGYLLTAAHCCESLPLLIVARTTDGMVRQSPARVVWMGRPDIWNQDVAIVHAPGMAVAPARWPDPDSIRAGTEVISAGGLVGSSIAVTGGAAVDRSLANAETGMTETALILPVVPGHSGGPVFTADGSLIGIITRVESEFPMGSWTASAIRLDPALVANAIELDRAGATATESGSPAAVAPASLGGWMIRASGFARLTRVCGVEGSGGTPRGR